MDRGKSFSVALALFCCFGTTLRSEPLHDGKISGLLQKFWGKKNVAPPPRLANHPNSVLGRPGPIDDLVGCARQINRITLDFAQQTLIPEFILHEDYAMAPVDTAGKKGLYLYGFNVANAQNSILYVPFPKVTEKPERDEAGETGRVAYSFYAKLPGDQELYFDCKDNRHSRVAMPIPAGVSCWIDKKGHIKASGETTTAVSLDEPEALHPLRLALADGVKYMEKMGQPHLDDFYVNTILSLDEYSSERRSLLENDEHGKWLQSLTPPLTNYIREDLLPDLQTAHRKGKLPLEFIMEKFYPRTYLISDDVKKQIVDMVLDGENGQARLLDLNNRLRGGLRVQEKLADTKQYHGALSGLKACTRLEGVPGLKKIAEHLIEKVQDGYAKRHPRK